MGMWEFGGICELLFKLLFKLPKVGVGAFIFAPISCQVVQNTGGPKIQKSLELHPDVKVQAQGQMQEQVLRGAGGQTGRDGRTG